MSNELKQILKEIAGVLIVALLGFALMVALLAW